MGDDRKEDFGTRNRRCRAKISGNHYGTQLEKWFGCRSIGGESTGADYKFRKHSNRIEEQDCLGTIKYNYINILNVDADKNRERK